MEEPNPKHDPLKTTFGTVAASVTFVVALANLLQMFRDDHTAVAVGAVFASLTGVVWVAVGYYFWTARGKPSFLAWIQRRTSVWNHKRLAIVAMIATPVVSTGVLTTVAVHR